MKNKYCTLADWTKLKIMEKLENLQFFCVKELETLEKMELKTLQNGFLIPAEMQDSTTKFKFSNCWTTEVKRIFMEVLILQNESVKERVKI